MEDGGQEGQWFEKPWKNARAMGRWTITRSCYAPSTSCSDKNIKCKAILSQVYNSMSWKWSTLKCLKKDEMEDEMAKTIKTQSNMHTLGVWLETIGHMVGTYWEHGENTKKPKRISKVYYPCHVPPKRKKIMGGCIWSATNLAMFIALNLWIALLFFLRVIINPSCLWALVWAWKPNSYPSLVNSQQNWRGGTCCWRWHWSYNAHNWSYTYEHDKIAPV